MNEPINRPSEKNQEVAFPVWKSSEGGGTVSSGRPSVSASGEVALGDGRSIAFDVEGTPVGMPRASRTRGGKHVRSTGADEWQRSIRDACSEAMRRLAQIEFDQGNPEPSISILFGAPLFGSKPVSLDLEFRFARPLTHFLARDPANPLKSNAPTWHTSKPDRDNADKAVLDALGAWKKTNPPLLYRDDSQVCDGPPIKRYVRPGELPGVFVRARALD